ncbi:hypothetical protein EV198_0507 [Roseivirga ehrenbergii]|nr:hypothetical protein EV198_0507 [Roseivirga ehrenbergii]
MFNNSMNTTSYFLLSFTIGQKIKKGIMLLHYAHLLGVG